MRRHTRRMQMTGVRLRLLAADRRAGVGVGLLGTAVAQAIMVVVVLRGPLAMLVVCV